MSHQLAKEDEQKLSKGTDPARNKLHAGRGGEHPVPQAGRKRKIIFQVPKMWRTRMEMNNMLNALLSSLTNNAARAIPLAVVAALAAMATAQNLVPNPSFEDTVDCSTPTQCTLLKATHWYNPTISTPDVWDADTARLCGYDIRTQGVGQMQPQDGDRMAGGFFWDGPSNGPTREYMLTRLTEELAPEAAYQVSLWYVRNAAFGSAVDHIGIWLGNDSIHEPTWGPMDLVPQVRLRDPNSEYLTNGTQWTQLVDTFTAMGGERWLVIGNFDPQDSIQAIVADPVAPYSNCYYYVDHVAVEALHEAGIQEFANAAAYWDGRNLVLHAEGFYGTVTVDVLDALGRHVYHYDAGFTEGQVAIPMDQYPRGLYVVRMRCAQREAVVKFVKGEGGQ